MARYVHRWFSRRSYTALAGVEPPLVTMAALALVRSPWDFVVIEGLRTKDRQLQLLNSGDTWTMRSLHLIGRAIDIAALTARGDVSWEPHYYSDIAEEFKAAAKQLGVPLVWGGDWEVRDYGHFEIPRDYVWRTS